MLLPPPCLTVVLTLAHPSCHFGQTAPSLSRVDIKPLSRRRPARPCGQLQVCQSSFKGRFGAGAPVYYLLGPWRLKTVFSVDRDSSGPAGGPAGCSGRARIRLSLQQGSDGVLYVKNFL